MAPVYFILFYLSLFYFISFNILFHFFVFYFVSASAKEVTFSSALVTCLFVSGNTQNYFTDFHEIQ